MINDILKTISDLIGLFDRHAELKDGASLYARQALAMTQFHLSMLQKGHSLTHKDQKELTLSWAEAASKMRRVDKSIASEFRHLSSFWADFDSINKASIVRIAEYIEHLNELLIDRNMLFAN